MDEIIKEKIIYFVKRPDEKGRASFSIIKKTSYPGRKAAHEIYRGDSVTAINESHWSGVFDRTTAEMEIIRICDELNKIQKKESKGVWVSSDANLKLLEDYWYKEYEDRKIRKPESARARLEQSIELIGPHSLLAERRELQKVVDGRCKGNPRKQRRMCSVLNQMRKWFGVKERLRLEKKIRPKFLYLTEEEFYKANQYVEVGPKMEVSKQTLQDLYEVLFSSGVRVSEAFAFTDDHFHNGPLQVLGQLDREWNDIETKTGRIRSTVLFKRGEQALSRWIAAEDKELIIRNGIAKILRNACKKAFPKRPDKWVSARDLRHSFAVACLTKHGLSIDTISKLLGNSVTVCEEYYLNFVPENDWLKSVLKKIASR